MIVDGEDLRDLASGPGRFGGNQMAAYLWVKSLDGSTADDESGSIEAPCGWFARFGKWLLTEDDRGFVSAWKADSAAAAVDEFDALMTEYVAWDRGDED